MRSSGSGDDNSLLPDLIRLVDSLADQFEAEFRAGSCPDKKAFLARAPEPARAKLRRYLDAIEEEYRLPVFGGKYPAVHQLSRGGQGHIVLAFDPQIRRAVVVKWALPDLPECQAQKLLTEAQILSRLSLNDPGVVQVLDTGIQDGRRFVVYEYIEGRPVDDVIKREHMPIAEAVALVADRGHR